MAQAWCFMDELSFSKLLPRWCIMFNVDDAPKCACGDLCSMWGESSGAALVNKGEGSTEERDEDTTGRGCSREGESCDWSGGGVDDIFLLPFSVACSHRRAPEEVAEEIGYLMCTIRWPGVNNKGESFTKHLAPWSATSGVEHDVTGVSLVEISSVCEVENKMTWLKVYQLIMTQGWGWVCLGG